MIQFYAPDIDSSLELPGEESAHCCRVLRKKDGEIITVVNGKGTRYECRITDADPRATRVEILRIFAEEIGRDYRITLAVAPTKNSDRMEWMVEKCVEIGIDLIVFLICHRSERKKINIERLKRVAVSAMKQSLKSSLPEILCENDFGKYINGYKNSEASLQKFIGYCSPEIERKVLSRMLHKEEDVVILIGPEGDFTTEEVSLAIDCGFQPVTFGDERLRTETACIYAVSAVHVINSL